MKRLFLPLLAFAFLTFSCTRQPQTGGAPAPDGPPLNPEYFPVTFSFVVGGKPAPVRAYFELNDQPYLIDTLGWRMSLTIDSHYHDRAYPIDPSIPVLDMIYDNLHHWYFTSGRATLPMLPGHYRLDVYKGTEFVPLHVEFDLNGSEREKTFELERWIDLAAEGWHAGDDHIHLTRQPENDELFLRLLEADGLAVGHFLQLQRREQLAVQYAWGDEGQAGRDGYIIRSGEEQRSHFYGHNLMLGIDSLVRPVSLGMTYALTPHADPLTEELFRHARNLGGTVGCAHGVGSMPHSATIVDLAHGDIDFMEVFQFCDVYSEFWYNALSCGFRIPGGAGSDFPFGMTIHKLWPRLIPLFGPDRMYVHVDGPLTFDKWMAGMKRGNAVLTNGPFVELTAGGVAPGSDLRLVAGKNAVAISVRVRHWRPMREARLLVNGQVARTWANGQAETDWRITDEIALERSSWLAVYVESDTTGAGDMAVPLKAHTNPVYVVVDDRPLAVPEALADEIARLEGMRAYWASDTLQFTFESSRLRLLERADFALEVLRARLAGE